MLPNLDIHYRNAELTQIHATATCPGIEPCKVSWNHSGCGKLCHELRAPCAKDCSWSCPHRERSQLSCAVLCDLIPCSGFYANTLACGHAMRKGYVDLVAESQSMNQLGNRGESYPYWARLLALKPSSGVSQNLDQSLNSS